MSLLLAQLSGLQNYTLTVSVGTYTLTGIAVTFDIVMPVSAGAYVLTGVAAFFAIVMPAVAGSCALTEVAAAINSARSLGASAGSLCPDRGGRFFRHRHARRERGPHP